jgi:ferredoxin
MPSVPVVAAPSGVAAGTSLRAVASHLGTSRRRSNVPADPDDLRVWVDQELCTGDGLCVQYAPGVFEFDLDGLAYVKNDHGVLQIEAGSRVGVPAHLRLDVIDAARDCPGECIHVLRAADHVEVAGPPA